VRRLPYLFSAAPKDYNVPDVEKKLIPPSKTGFPPTHELLENSMSRLIESLESILTDRPFIFGGQFTIADASIYGQLSMNMDDPPAARMIKQKSPVLYKWLVQIRQKDFSCCDTSKKLELDESQKPLFSEICRTYVPLMKQNLEAYENYKDLGETVFNEVAFNKNTAIYEGVVDNYNFKSVVKTFQVKTWLELRGKWDKLDDDSKKRLESILPANHGLDKDI
jgi:Glutathione S-transferase, C-terminal domain